MKKWQKITLGIVGGILLIAAVAMMTLARSKAHDLLMNPMATRNFPKVVPADFNLPVEDVTVTTADGLHLLGWYVPSQNGAVVMLQHGYKSDRGEMVNEADMLHRHGYGALIESVRAHDHSDGEMITFGYHEMADLQAWYQYLLTRKDVQPDRIAILGNSMGGSLVIQYASQNPAIKAVVTNSAFSSLDDTVGVSVTHFTGLPAFPFEPMIVFWAEQEAGFKASDIDSKLWIGKISPRPVFLMQGGADTIISVSSGQRLYDAAGQPKELWFEPSLGHTDFDQKMPVEYEKRVTAFFDKYLLGK